MDLKSGYPFWTVSNGLLANFPPLQRHVDCEVAIVGAGITGALIARSLADAGLEVVLLDKRDVGWGSTAASTALLQYEIDVELVALARKFGARLALMTYRACEQAIDVLAGIAAASNDKSVSGACRACIWPATGITPGAFAPKANSDASTALR